jgi:ParB family chromosome partitioning protein
MAEDAARSRLGRGLAALIGDVGTESSAERPRGQRRVPTTSLRPNARNPRRMFSEEELDELTASLRERGMIQPIVARPVRGAPDAFEIIAGERRWRAAPRAGLHEVPVVIVEATDEESLQLAIIENVQRADLNPLEEAEGYRALMEDYSHTQDDIAKMVGKSRSHVANTLRLLKLPPSIRGYILKGKLDAGHARMLVGQPNAEKLADEIVARGLNVRQVEEIARQESGRNGKPRSRMPLAEKSADTQALEKRLSDALGLVVSIDARGESGVVSIRYRNLDQLDDLAQRLEKKQH